MNFAITARSTPSRADRTGDLVSGQVVPYVAVMSNPPKVPPEDPNLAAFRAILAKKKAAKSPETGPMPARGKPKGQKPRPKERMRRRP